MLYLNDFAPVGGTSVFFFFFPICSRMHHIYFPKSGPPPQPSDWLERPSVRVGAEPVLAVSAQL